MDKIIATKSAEILEFSNIALILSYYDYLDQWKKVMKRLCKLAQEQWMNNENAFINFGEQVKRNLYMTSKDSNWIQWVIQDRHLCNKILFKRDKFNSYVSEIAVKLKPGQVLNMNLHADDTNYMELHFAIIQESNIFIPSLKWLIHKPISKVRTESSMLYVLRYFERNLDFYSYSIQKIDDNYEIKQMLSPIIKATAYSEIVYSNRKRKIKTIYSGEKWECWPHTVVWEYLILINYKFELGNYC